ncbi:MAG: hypothetical protein ACRDJC_23940, partial [Thermomicrobiales bacterium]
GHAQRGRRRLVAAGCPVHARSAFGPDPGLVLAHEPIDAGPDQAVAVAVAERSVAPALLARIEWPGRVRTGDVWCCQRPLCQQVMAAGGD